MLVAVLVTREPAHVELVMTDPWLLPKLAADSIEGRGRKLCFVVPLLSPVKADGGRVCAVVVGGEKSDVAALPIGTGLPYPIC